MLAPVEGVERYSASVVLVIFTAIFVTAIDAIRNIFFHPLSAFPGPRLAASSTWWSAYQQVIMGRSMHHICERLHEQYGDIVRIGPNRLHFNHPSMYEEIYRKRWDKDPYMYALLGGDGSTVTFVKYEDNKARKDILHPFFTKSSVLDREWMIHENVEKFCNVLTKQNKAGQSSDLSLGFRCLGLETITSTCFGKSVDCFSNDDFHSPVLEAMEAMATYFMAFKHFAIIRMTILSLPQWLSLKLFPKGIAFAELRKTFDKQIDSITAQLEDPNEYRHPIIYRSLLSPENYNGRPLPSRESLIEEAIALLIAGTDTTGTTITIGTYRLLRDPKKCQRLKAELRQAWPNLEDRPSSKILEKLPYLTAVIKESLRIAPTTTSEFSRVVPPQGGWIAGKFIPGNTTVSMGTLFSMKHEDAFENPTKFEPERWLAKDAAALDKYFVPFSKGPRSCLGIKQVAAVLKLS
ncbi:hypothetical protein G6011_09539 [Alternaria panax]|uniref:Cytochrome P450 monooxygenase n=1 Tax=Alternaria panax TaxID=48097 RepID=A0AAD4I7B8_9PLEO|nr:hypothetical protein G6011_09539 [Alternaria panax]